MGGLPFTDYLREYQSELTFETYRHALLSLEVLIIAAVLSVALSMLVYRSRWASSTLISISVIAFTVPSLALFGLLQPVFGLGLGTVFPVVVTYATIPVVRNTIIGLQVVEPALVDAALGLGMSRRAILFRVELPLAWPVILTGIRVAAQLTLGLVALAAFIGKIGLGTFIFDALNNLGSVNTFNSALAGTLLIAVLALGSDLAFVVVRRLTTPRGIRG
jgi:osmoprotectant transport system permease protein